jgi:hypothetical protein
LRLALDVLTNVAAAAVIFFLGWAWRHFYLLPSHHRTRGFWGPRGAQFTVILGTIAKFPEYEPSGLVNLAEVTALAELTPFLSAHGYKRPRVVYTSDESRELSGDLILLGGPDVNEATRIMMDRLGGALVQSSTRFLNRLTGDELAPSRSPSGSVVRDVGVAIKAPNPLDPTSRVVILSGGYGYGTRAAVRLAMSSDFLNRPDTKDSWCEYLFISEVIDGSPQPARLLPIRRPHGEVTPQDGDRRAPQ